MTKEFNINQLIGLNEIDARKICINNGYSFRITRKDNINYIITCDLNLYRINVEIDNDLISEVNFG